MTDRPEITPQSLEDWTLEITSTLTAPGAITVEIVATNPLIGASNWTVDASWKAGQEREDAVGEAVGLLAVSVQGLAAALAQARRDALGIEGG